jgi:histidyl-tRNA synthetase
MGCELIGGSKPDSEAEAVALASRMLQSVGVSGDIHIGYLGLIRSILGKIPVEHRSSVMRMIDKKERDALATLLEEIGCSHLGLLELIGSKGESALDRAAQIVADWKPGQEATVQAAAAAPEPVSTNEAADVTYSPAGRGSARQGRAVEAQLHLEEFVQTVDLLRAYGVNFTIDFEIVRGLEYYSGTVFEIYAEGLGAQRQICGGGTYELASLFAGKEPSSTGFGLGFDRIMEIVQMNSSRPRPVFMAFTPDVKREAARIASRLRESVPVVMDVMGRGLKAQLKAAAGAGADYAVIVGKDELDAGRMTLRDMSGGAQESLLIAEIEARLKEHFQDKFG